MRDATRARLAAALYVLAAFAAIAAGRALGALGHDFASYWFGAGAVLTGRPLYEGTAACLTRLPDAFPFCYPPPAVLLAVPFRLPGDAAAAAGLDGFQVGLLLWEAALAAAWGMACAWLWRRTNGRIPLAAPALTLLGLAAWDGLVEGNVTFLLAAGLVGVLAAMVAGRPRLAGALVGAMVLVKLTPALLVVWLVGRREWRVLGWAGASAGVLAVVTALLPGGLTAWRDWPAALPTLFAPHAIEPLNLAPANQLALAGLLPADAVRALDLALVAAAIVGAVALGRRASLVAGWAGVILLMLLGAPQAWPHYLALLSGPALLALAAAGRTGRLVAFPLAWLVAGFAILTPAPWAAWLAVLALVTWWRGRLAPDAAAVAPAPATPEPAVSPAGSSAG